MIREQSRPRARRLALGAAPLPRDVVHADYADAFTLEVSPADERSAEAWVRAGLERAPAPVRLLIRVAHRHVLRFRLADPSDDTHVLGWRVAESRHDMVRLEAESPLMRGVIVGSRIDPSRMVLGTALMFVRPRFARLIWTFVGPVHRMVAPLLLERAAHTSADVLLPPRAVAVVIRDGAVLVVRRRQAGRSYSVLPGGGIEPGETPQSAAERELLEEASLRGRAGRLVHEGTHRAGRPAYYFLMDDVEGEAVLGGEELAAHGPENSYELAWVTGRELVGIGLQPAEALGLLHRLMDEPEQPGPRRHGPL